tara:strand:- start:235 stop:972 length:738 start_codon:yes stop_codon:yes gene_type:complete
MSVIEEMNSNGQWEEISCSKLKNNNGGIMYNTKKQYAQDIQLDDMDDKEVFVELTNKGKNKVWWRHKFMPYLPLEVVEQIQSQVQQHTEFKMLKQLSSKLALSNILTPSKFQDRGQVGTLVRGGFIHNDGNYSPPIYDYTNPFKHLRNMDLGYKRRTIPDWTKPRCSGHTKKGTRCHLGGTEEKKITGKWKGNITNIVGRFGMEFKHFCKYHAKEGDDLDTHYRRLGYKERNGYICKVCPLPEGH